MKDPADEFITWGIKAGLPQPILSDLAEFAATPDELRRAIDEGSPPPPVYPVAEIREMHEEDPMGITPGKAGFLVVGTCPNGDPIAIDIGDEPGTVWYISHEQMFGKNPQGLRSVAVKVASSIPGFFQSMAEKESFPMDYWDAS